MKLLFKIDLPAGQKKEAGGISILIYLVLLRTLSRKKHKKIGKTGFAPLSW